MPQTEAGTRGMRTQDGLSKAAKVRGGISAPRQAAGQRRNMQPLAAEEGAGTATGLDWPGGDCLPMCQGEAAANVHCPFIVLHEDRRSQGTSHPCIRAKGGTFLLPY